jgi:LysR family glycine cleavage system transcriptional activator
MGPRDGWAARKHWTVGSASIRSRHSRLLQRLHSGVITISVSPDFAAKWLVSRLGRFAEAYPEMELKVSATMHHVDFAREDVDLAIRHGAGNYARARRDSTCTDSSRN